VYSSVPPVATSLTIVDAGGAIVVDRIAKEQDVELTADERARLSRGGTYVWQVAALNGAGALLVQSEKRAFFMDAARRAE
jgi:hypothetical protein